MDKNLQYKIVKKHIKSRKFDDDVYVLMYQSSILHIWKEYPICFTNEDILKDFIKFSYLFDFDFKNIESTEIFNTEFAIKIKKKGFNIYFVDVIPILGMHVYVENVSHFTIIESKYMYEAPYYRGDYLSSAYKNFVNSPKVGVIKIEEKVYKLILENNDTDKG